MASSINAIGIDLGTTYSCIAILNEQGRVETLANAQNDRLTPSAVFFDQDDIIIGQIAKDAYVSNPNDVILFIKREIGNSNWQHHYKNDRYTPIDISALILKKLKQDAEIRLAKDIPYAIITVPAWFDDARRRATILAGEQAGLKVLGVLNEPTAAALAYGYDAVKQKEILLVYDLGGGTFDATLLNIQGNEIDVLGATGHHRLGGKDFDDIIIQYATAQFKAQHKKDPLADPNANGSIRQQAEKLKHELSMRSKSSMSIAAHGLYTRVELDRQTFSNLIKPKIDITLIEIRNLLTEKQLTIHDINRVLLVGGSTRIPSVQQALRNYFGYDPDNSVDPDTVVASGAAIYAAQELAKIDTTKISEKIAERIGGIVLNDVTTYSVGILTSLVGTGQKIISKMIERNSPIPITKTETYTTEFDGQTAIRIQIYQGESSVPDECAQIGEFTLKDLPSNRPAGQKIRIEISYTKDSIIKIASIDIATGKRAEAEVSYKADFKKENRNLRDRWK